MVRTLNRIKNSPIPMWMFDVGYLKVRRYVELLASLCVLSTIVP